MESRGPRFRPAAWTISLAAVLGLALALLISGAAMAAAGGAADEGVSPGLLAAAMVVGWVGNLLHRVKKVVRAETDQAIVDYLRSHSIVFVIGLLVAAVAVWVEASTYASDWGSLLWSALITGYGADSLLEARVNPPQDESLNSEL